MDPDRIVITRESIRSGLLRRMMATRADIAWLSEEELARSRAETRAAGPPGDVWVFGYGSLIWNPAFHHAETRMGRVHGWHRRFCLWTQLGRGTPEQPGLTLGLERGGSCRGVVFRIEAAQADEELDLIWRREMVTAAYRPVWASVATADGPVRAIAFTINRRHDRYAGGLGLAEIADVLARARGPLGSCADYLFNTEAHLRELGIRDRDLSRVAQAVRQRLPAGAGDEAGAVRA